MSKPTPKLKVKRRQSTSSQRPALVSEPQGSLDLDLDEVEQNVNVQVRQREPSPERGRSKLGILKDQASGTLQKGIEGIKRPMSSLLKRPGSRSGSKDRSAARSASKDRDLDNIELPADIELNDDAKPNSAGPKFPRKTTESWAADEDPKPARPGTGMGRSGSKAKLNQSPSRNITTDAVDGYIPNGDDSTTVELPDLRNSSKTPEIPHLEEMHSSEFGTMVAQAPSVALNKMASYKELDGELAKHAAFQTLDGIDLSLLTKCLCPENETREEKVPWNWDYLFTSVCSDLHHDWMDENEDEVQFEDQTAVEMETGD